MATITSSNATFVLTVGTIGLSFTVQGYAADDAFTAESVTTAETVMGVDGKKSAGYVPHMVPFTFTLQADSSSNDKMDALITYQDTMREVVRLDAVITYPALGKSFTLVNGTLKTYPPMSAAKRTLQARTFGIDWESIKPALI